MQKKDRSVHEEDDIVLIQSVLGGNTKDFELIWNRYHKLIYAHVLKLVRNIDDADDIVQDTFIKAFNALHTYNQSYPFTAWLYKISSNTCIDYFRRKRIRPVSIEGIQKTTTSIYDIIPDQSIGIDFTLINAETKDALHKAIKQLPDRYRECIELRHFQELSYEEIAQKLNLPLGTIKITLFRARKALSTLLAGKDMSMHS